MPTENRSSNTEQMIPCDDGLHLIQLDENMSHYGWVFRKVEGGWPYSVRKATEHEMAHAKARQHLRAGAAQIAVQYQPATQFDGDNATLISSINSLLALDAKGALVPNGVCGLARQLLEASTIRLAAQHQGEPVGEVVAFGESLHEIAWAQGKLPRLGTKLYTSPPTSDGFSAGDMADQGAKAFRDGQRALVLPDRELYTKYLSGVIPNNAEEVNGYKDGWNACLDEVRRLNEADIATE
ncbi:hypothetical protein D3C77_406640 [compost metagenome]